MGDFRCNDYSACFKDTKGLKIMVLSFFLPIESSKAN